MKLISFENDEARSKEHHRSARFAQKFARAAQRKDLPALK